MMLTIDVLGWRLDAKANRLSAVNYNFEPDPEASQEVELTVPPSGLWMKWFPDRNPIQYDINEEQLMLAVKGAVPGALSVCMLGSVDTWNEVRRASVTAKYAEGEYSMWTLPFGRAALARESLEPIRDEHFRAMSKLVQFVGEVDHPEDPVFASTPSMDPSKVPELVPGETRLRASDSRSENADPGELDVDQLLHEMREAAEYHTPEARRARAREEAKAREEKEKAIWATLDWESEDQRDEEEQMGQARPHDVMDDIHRLDRRLRQLRDVVVMEGKRSAGLRKRVTRMDPHRRLR